MSRSRLVDVARATGYSVNTVSLALRGSDRVADATRAAIEEAAWRLAYVPNRVARSLVERRTRTIGVVLTDIMNPSLTSVAQRIERELAAHDLSMVLVTTEQSIEREKRALEVLSAQQVDGILVFPVQHTSVDHIRAVSEGHRPVVLLAGKPGEADVDLVAMDNVAGARRAVEYLLELGHRRVGLVNGGVRIGNSEKLEGYVAAHAAADVPVDESRIEAPSGFGFEDGFRAADRLLERAPDLTAILASTDQLAIGALALCRERGIGVPEHLSIIGYDDTPAARYTHPKLTSVAYDADLIARGAVQRLIERIEGGDVDTVRTPERRVYLPELVVRSSTGAPRDGAIPNVSQPGGTP